jgi:hypothetical protein
METRSNTPVEAIAHHIGDQTAGLGITLFACGIHHRAIVRTARLFCYRNAGLDASTSWGAFYRRTMTCGVAGSPIPS